MPTAFSFVYHYDFDGRYVTTWNEHDSDLARLGICAYSVHQTLKWAEFKVIFDK